MDIEMQDPITGLDTFMLAAAGPTSNFETLYELLRGYPSVMNIYINMENNHQDIKRKEKNSSLKIVDQDITVIKTKSVILYFDDLWVP